MKNYPILPLRFRKTIGEQAGQTSEMNDSECAPALYVVRCVRVRRRGSTQATPRVLPLTLNQVRSDDKANNAFSCHFDFWQKLVMNWIKFLVLDLH